MNTKEAMHILFCENLGQTQIDENETIFDLGGNSLIIYKICQQAKERFQIQLKPIDLMMYPSIKKVSDYLESPGQEVETQKVTVCRRNLGERRRRRNER